MYKTKSNKIQYFLFVTAYLLFVIFSVLAPLSFTQKVQANDVRLDASEHLELNFVKSDGKFTDSMTVSAPGGLSLGGDAGNFEVGDQYIFTDAVFKDSDPDDGTIEYVSYSRCGGGDGTSKIKYDEGDHVWKGEIEVLTDECDKLITNLHAPLNGSPSGSSSDRQAEWINKVHIRWNDIYYTNINPFDDIDRWENASNGCTSKLTDVYSNSTRANVINQAKDSGGNCVVIGATTLIIEHINRKNWTAYRVDEDTIFMPAYIQQDDWVGDHYSPRQNGLFRRVPEDQRVPEETDDIFPNYNTGNWDNVMRDENAAGSWIVLSELKQRSRGCGGDVDTPLPIDTGSPCKSHSEDITFANDGDITRPPSIYDIEALATDTDGDSNDSVAPPSCESKNSILLSWLLCSVLDLVDNTIVGLGNAADELLNIPGDYYEDPGLKSVWSYFRAIATFMLLGVGLFVVISQAMGDLLGAYTVKKILPRLVIAAILIQLSWELFTLLIQIVNQIAWGVEGLMYAPFGGKGVFDFKNIVSTAGGSANGIFVAAAVGIAGSTVIGGSILSLALVALVGLLIGFGFLLFRQVLVVVLLLIAPIALLCWILPNTEKFWKLWWESFSKLLLMYPIILFMIAGGRIFAWVAARVDPGGQEQNLFEAAGVNDIVTVAIITIGYFGPFFLIPKAFQAAGSAFATITGMANDRSKGFFDNQRKARAEKRKGRIERASSNSLWNQKQGGWRGAMAKRANTAAGWAVAPGSNAAYALKDKKIFGAPVPFSRSGRRIASQIEHAGVEQTQKLQQLMNGAGANDKTYRVLGGMHSGLSDPVKERFRSAGLYDRELTSEKDILKAAEIMATSDSDTEQLASGALHGLAPTLSSLYADPEMTKASIAGAAAIGLASHGFAGGEDLAHVGNMLKEQHGLPFAQTVVGQAQLAGARSRPDVKNGYGVVLNNDGNFVDGMSEEGGRAEAVLATIGVGDIAGAKGGFLTKMGGTMKNAIERGDTDGARDAFTRVAQLRPELKARIRQENPNMSQTDVDQLAARQLAEMRDQSGNSIVDMANDYKLAKSLKEELFLAASQFSSAPIDTKGQATEMLTELGLSKELSEHDIKAAQRQGLDAGAGAAAAAAAAPPAPTGPTGPTST